MSTQETRRDTQIRRDYRTLAQLDDMVVSLSEDGHRIVIHNFSYPDGWTPSTDALLIRYPEHYPRMQPGVYLTDTVSYSGRVTHLMGSDGLDGGWRRWCTHYLDWKRWTSYCEAEGEHPLLAFLTLVRESLKHPARSNPIEHADPRTD